MLPPAMQGLTPEQFNVAMLYSGQQVVDMSQIDEIFSADDVDASGEPCDAPSSFFQSRSSVAIAQHVFAQKLLRDLDDMYDQM
jgi:hypothetical protein